MEIHKEIKLLFSKLNSARKVLNICLDITLHRNSSYIKACVTVKRSCQFLESFLRALAVHFSNTTSVHVV
jgi:hypothetical protein